MNMMRLTALMRCCNKQRIVVISTAFIVFALSVPCYGQGTMQVRFEGQMSPGYYFESGMWFGNVYGGPEVLVLRGSGASTYPDNGTQYLQMTAGTGLAFAFSSYAAFDLVSFDVAEYYTGLPGPRTLHVVGYISGGQGATVTTDLTTDGIIDGPGGLSDFQTFTLGSAFQNLYRVEILTDRWSLDNLVISGVPEPSSITLIALATLCAFGRSLMRNRRRWDS